MFRKALIAASLSTAMPAVAQQTAPPEQPVVVGIIDVAATRVIGGDRRTEINYREFNTPGTKSARWNTVSGADHGQVVATAFVDQVREMDRNRPIRIFAANPMEERADSRSMGMNFQGAIRALNWFKENNVTVVLTTMTGRDGPNMRAFMAEADRLGMVVFASSGNDNRQGERQFPAAYPQTISVSGDHPSLALKRDPTVSQWTDFVMNGDFRLLSVEGDTQDEGSSMATARAAAAGAYAVATGRASDRQSIEGVLQNVSEPRTMQTNTGGHRFQVQYIPMQNLGQRLRQIEVAQQPEEGIDVATLMAAQQARGGYGR